MTSDISTMRHIESAVKECVNCARDPQEHYPEFIASCPAAWRMGLLEGLRTLDVCSFQLAVPTPSKRPQGDLGPGGTLEADPNEQHVQGFVDVELLTPAPAVCPYLITPAPYSLLIIYSP